MIEYDKNGDPIYRPPIAEVIAKAVLDFITKAQADPEAQVTAEDIEWIIRERLVYPDWQWYSTEARIALQKRRKLLTKDRFSKADRDKLNELEKIIGRIPSGQSRVEIEASLVIQRAAARMRAQECNDEKVQD